MTGETGLKRLVSSYERFPNGHNNNILIINNITATTSLASNRDRLINVESK